jgi:hypothetical protein
MLAVGDGWYRCSITLDGGTGATSSALLYQTDNGSAFSYTGNGTSGIFLWGAQLELGSTATTYNPTTVKNLLGFTENFDNAAWTKSNAFVQTNLVAYSQEFDNAAWTKQFGSITTSNVTAPDGTATAEVFTPSAQFGNVRQLLGTAITAGQVTVSVWLRTQSGTRELNIRATASGVLYLTPVTATTTWTRFTSTFTYDGTNSMNEFVVQDRNVSGFVPFEVWGAQLVQGATPGDYKATYAAAAAVGYTDIYGQPFAQKLVSNNGAAANTANITQTVSAVSGTVYTYSCYAKSAGAVNIRLRMTGSGTWASALVDLNTGVISGTLLTGTATATAVGNGWYRITISAASDFTGTNTSWVYPYDAGNGTDGVLVFGAQLSDSASVDPYVYQPVAAPTSTAYYGPRFDYDPVTLAPKGLLIEEQRTNLLLQSATFDNAAWNKGTGGAISANSVVAPDGTTTADAYTFATSTGVFAYLSQTVSTASNVANTYSIWVKRPLGSGSRTFRLAISDVTISTANSSTFTATETWQRFEFTRTSPNSTGSVGGGFILGGVAPSIAGGEILEVWGAQLEAGAFATSYIPTVASQVTRAADGASMIGNNFARWYNQTEGSVFVQANAAALIASSGNPGTFVGISNGTVSNRLRLKSENGTAWEGAVAGTSQFAIGAYGSAGVSYKLAGAYKVNDFAYSFSGTTAATDTSGTVPFVSQMQIGNLLTAREFSGTISRIAYYNRRLSNTELQGITS